MLIAPIGMIAHADTVATTTSPVFQPGGHATNAEMQAVMTPANFQIYLASKGGVPTANVSQADTVRAIILQIVALLQQEIVLIQAGQN